MFGNNNPKSNGKESSYPNGGNSDNRFGVGTIIEGEIRSAGDIRIDGKIIGTVSTQAKIVIGKNGTVEGDIFCKNANIQGKVIGTIEVEELLDLKRTANIEGEIITNKLVVEEGAMLIATCSMGPKAKRKSTSNEVHPKVELKAEFGKEAV